MHIPRGHMLFLNHKEYNERKTGGNCMTIKEAAAKTDLTPDFERIDAMEYRQMTHSVRSINVRGKRSIFPTRLNQEDRFREKRSVPGID